MARLVIANWKLNPQTEREAILLARASDHKNVVICPPFPFIGTLRKILRNAVLGAQNIFWEEEGPYTGEVSSHMLKSAGVHYVLTGHSERRALFSETDEIINKKIQNALYGRLEPVLCVGEPLAVRRRGMSHAEQFVKSQLTADLRWIKRKVTIAYEPVWAVGTGRPDNPEETAKMARFIKKFLSPKFKAIPKVLYGGSVTSKNIRRIISYKEIDGVLVGGASLKRQEFSKIIEITL